MTTESTRNVLHPECIKHLRSHAKSLDEQIAEIYNIDTDADNLQLAISELQKKCAYALTDISHCIYVLAGGFDVELDDEAVEDDE
jgi:hypothetical protein